MKLKDKLYLIHKSNSYIKNRKIIITLFVFSILLIVLSSSFKMTLDKYFYEGVMKDISYKTFFVDPKTNEDASELIEKLEKVNHVVDAFPSNYNHFIVDIEKLNEESATGGFFLVGAKDIVTPNVIKGTAITQENEIICPSLFYPNSYLEEKQNLKGKDLIKMDKYLNKTLSVFYYSYKDSSDDYNNKEKRNLELKIVGIYKNNPSYIDENVCYASRSLIEKMYDDTFQNLDNSNSVSSLMFQIDDVNNIDYVRKEIKNLGYIAYSSFILNQGFFDFTKYISYFIMLMSFIISIIIIAYVNKKELNDKRKEINIYRSLGFSKKDIAHLISLEKICLGFLGVIISLFIISLIFGSLQYLIKVKPFIFQKLPITLSIPSIIISILISSMALFFTTAIYKKTILSNKIIANIKD